MKIFHVCLASHYTQGMAYQDNQLSDQNAKDGHEVILVSDCYMYEGVNLIKVQEEDRTLPSGVRLIRLEYDRVINELISSKVRKVKKLYSLIVKESPDVILFHGVAGWEMLSVAKYKKENPHIKLYMDSHGDFNNSGRFWFSRFFQYQVFNRCIVKKIKPFVDQFLYISEESKDFLSRMYGLESREMEFYPLGGNVIERQKKIEFRDLIERRHGLSKEDIIILHTGKLDEGKKTKELIKAFSSLKAEELKLLIIGSIPKEQEDELFPLINQDERIVFLGWKDAGELPKYLAASDLYFQPGTQSATMQNAICSGTAVALYPYSSHRAYLKNNGFFVENTKDCIGVLETILSDRQILSGMSDASFKIAHELLDYRLLASRLYR